MLNIVGKQKGAIPLSLTPPLFSLLLHSLILLLCLFLLSPFHPQPPPQQWAPTDS